MKYFILFLLPFFLSFSLFAQNFALEQLENLPRHHEWVEVKSSDRTVHCFVAYPETSENTLAVIVIHENRGLTDWVRSFADQMAAARYLAIAPALLSDFAPDKAQTSSFESSDAARDAIYQLDPDQVTQDLQAVQDYIANVPASNGKTYEYEIYPGAGHAYMRQGNDPQGSAESKKATADSWGRIKDILDKL